MALLTRDEIVNSNTLEANLLAKELMDGSKSLNSGMFDFPTASQVEILSDDTGKLWVKVNGQCVVRVGRVKSLSVHTARRDEE